MNIQSISEFLDLVKNPDKYAKFLEEIKAEQDRLNAVIETVGKASELDQLRKQLDKERALFKQTSEQAESIRQEEVAAEVAALVAKKASADQLYDKATALLQEAEAKLLQAETVSQSFASKEKELRKQELSLTEEKIQLGAMITEYNEKLNKLRSVMA